MHFELCIGCAPFTPRPDVRLKEIISKFPEIELINKWKISTENTVSRVFGDWCWEVECSDDENLNLYIQKTIHKEMLQAYYDGKIRCANIEIIK